MVESGWTEAGSWVRIGQCVGDGRAACLKFVQLCHVRESKGVPALYSDDSLSRDDEPCLPYPKTV